MKKPPFATIVSLVIGLLGASAVAADAPPLTLTSLYESARESHPAMAAVRLDLAASQQDVRAVERQRWPVLSAVIESDTGTLSATPTHVLRVQLKRISHL